MRGHSQAGQARRLPVCLQLSWSLCSIVVGAGGPRGDAVSQYGTVLLQGTGWAHIPPADLNGNCFAG